MIVIRSITFALLVVTATAVSVANPGNTELDSIVPQWKKLSDQHEQPVLNPGSDDVLHQFSQVNPSTSQQTENNQLTSLDVTLDKSSSMSLLSSSSRLSRIPPVQSEVSFSAVAAGESLLNTAFNFNFNLLNSQENAWRINQTTPLSSSATTVHCWRSASSYWAVLAIVTTLGRWIGESSAR